MNKKTRVFVTSNDVQHKEYSKGDKGYIDGYVRGGDNVPYAVVVIEKRIVMIPIHSLEVIFKIPKASTGQDF